jgi:hypothetical protein
MLIYVPLPLGEAHARDPNFVKDEFQKALKSQRKGCFGMFGK